LAFITPALRPGLDPETRIQWALAHVTRTLMIFYFSVNE
jgi:hypothetical protein